MTFKISNSKFLVMKIRIKRNSQRYFHAKLKFQNKYKLKLIFIASHKCMGTYFIFRLWNCLQAYLH